MPGALFLEGLRGLILVNSRGFALWSLIFGGSEELNPREFTRVCALKLYPQVFLYVNLRTMKLPRATLYVNLRSMELPRADSYVKLRTMELPRATLYVNLRTMELPRATSYVNSRTNT